MDFSVTTAAAELLLFVTAFACGLIVRITLQLAGQQWARTYSNTVTYLLLPVVGLVIVQVISNSIALSLGMIGALSIVRFRHPVKSPLELTIYFLLLTIGVTLSQRLLLGLLLTLFSAILIISVSQYQNFRVRRGMVSPFATSTDVGEPLSTLEITSAERIQWLEEHPALAFSQSLAQSSQFTYKLIFHTRTEYDIVRAQALNEAAIESTTSYLS